MIRFICPKCQKSLKAPPDAAGRTALCPRCDTRLRVPAPPHTDEVARPHSAPPAARQRAPQVTPVAAVTRLAEIVAASPDLSEDEVYDAMAAAGIPAGLADRAYKFTQIAWGRLLLANVGVEFPPDYSYTTVDGDEEGEALLADEPCYTAAVRLAPQYRRTPAFKPLAESSAEVSSINAALDAGMEPENLTIGSTLVLIEPPGSAE